jgi:hypothetical protein
VGPRTQPGADGRRTSSIPPTSTIVASAIAQVYSCRLCAGVCERVQLAARCLPPAVAMGALRDALRAATDAPKARCRAHKLERLAMVTLKPWLFGQSQSITDQHMHMYNTCTYNQHGSAPARTFAHTLIRPSHRGYVLNVGCSLNQQPQPSPVFDPPTSHQERVRPLLSRFSQQLQCPAPQIRCYLVMAVNFGAVKSVHYGTV